MNEPYRTPPVVYVDSRYAGQHGIARYASEVIQRLTVPTVSAGLRGRPGSPLDALQSLPNGSSDLLYSPGYAGFFGSARQILTVHDLIHLQTRGIRGMKYAAYYSAVVRPAIKRAGVVLTVSETSRAAIETWLDDDRVSIVNAGNGCAEVFRPEPSRSREDYLLYVGNMREHKNFGVVLRALAIAPDLRLRAVVPQREAELLRAEATRMGVAAGRVIVHAGLDDDGLADLYHRARATVIPSLIEGFGLPALESVMCGTPVIYWAGCESVAEIVGDRGVAVVSASDHREWAEVLMMTNLPRVAISDGFADQWSWGRVARSVTEVLKSAAED